MSNECGHYICEFLLLYKDVYSSNEFAYAYDTIGNEQNN